MIGRCVRTLAWKPYERVCRRLPLAPFHATVSNPLPAVTCIRYRERSRARARGACGRLRLLGDLDTQLGDANGPLWIASLERS